MYDGRVCAWGADGGDISLFLAWCGAVRVFWLLPVSLFCGRVRRHSFTCSHTPSPTSSTHHSVALLSSSLPFFFFFAPPLLLSLSFRPLDVCKAQLCWPSTLCVSLARRLLSFIHPSPPPNYQPTRLPAPRLLEVTWDRIDRRLITFDRIDFFAAWFSCLFQ